MTDFVSPEAMAEMIPSGTKLGLARTAREIREMTGFSFDNDRCEVQTPRPDAETLALMRGQIRTELAETYPQFAASLPAEA